EFEKARRNIGVFSRAEETKRVHTAFARFDFDDVRAQFRQDGRAKGPGEHVIKAHDAHAVQRTVAASALTLSLSRGRRGNQPFKSGMFLATILPAVENRHAAHGGWGAGRGAAASP